MDANTGLFGIPHRMGECATHPLARPVKRLALSLLLAYPGRLRTRRGAGRGCKAAKAATATLSSLRASHSSERTIGRVQLRFLGLSYMAKQ